MFRASLSAHVEFLPFIRYKYRWPLDNQKDPIRKGENFDSRCDPLENDSLYFHAIQGFSSQRSYIYFVR